MLQQSYSQKENYANFTVCLALPECIESSIVYQMHNNTTRNQCRPLGACLPYHNPQYTSNIGNISLLKVSRNDTPRLDGIA